MINVWRATIGLCFLIINGEWKRMYALYEDFTWRSRKFNKTITVKAIFYWDGATKAIDFLSIAHMVHDWIVGTDMHEGTWAWDDGTPITPKQSSEILKEILDEEGRHIVANRWYRWTLVWQTVKHMFTKGKKK